MNLQHRRTLLFTSPQFTGKSTLAQLMYNYWQSMGIKVYYISFAGMKDNPSPTYSDFDHFFSTRIKKTYDQIEQEDCYLIIDEAQNIYGVVLFYPIYHTGTILAILQSWYHEYDNTTRFWLV